MEKRERTAPIWVIFKILNFVLLVYTGYIWLAFSWPPRGTLLSISVLMLLCMMIGNFKTQFAGHAIGLIGVLTVMAVTSAIISSDLIAQITVGYFLPAIFVYMLPADRQRDLLESVTKWYAIMIAASMAVYCMAWVAPIPSLGRFVVPNSDVYDPFINYGIYLKTTKSAIDALRFNGPFIEPGHLAMTSMFLLFANRLDFKRLPWLWVILAGVLLSLSLAGYMLLLIALVFLKFRSFASTLITALVVGAGYLFVTQLWNDGDNPVNQLVLARLEYDSRKGIKGNNRTLRTTDKYFNRCVEDGTIWLGVKNAQNKGDKISGAGYKIYLLKNGLLMLLLTTCFYLLLINPKGNKRYAIAFLIFVFLSFLQRGYLTWYSWLFSFTVGIGVTREINPFKKESVDSQEPGDEDRETRVEGLEIKES